MNTFTTLGIETHHTDQPGPLLVTLSAWNSRGHGDWFARSMVLSMKCPSILIAQRNGNHWWHTDDMLQVAEQVRTLKREGNRRVVLYGASMGGYGACHLMDMFEADHAIALSPQLLVVPENLPAEKRWLADRQRLADGVCFDELNSLGRSGAHLTVFHDPLHAMDNEHISRIHALNGGRSLLHLVPVPYTNHDAARILARQGVLKAFLAPLLQGGSPDWAAVEGCNLIYRRDAKSFFNYLRWQTERLSEVERSENLVMVQTFLTTSVDLDFEALYMAAEVFKRYERVDEATQLIERSIALYESRNQRPAPDYLMRKRDYIRGVAA